VKPILTRFWVFLATSALVVGSVALQAAGQDPAGSSKDPLRDGPTAAEGKTETASDAASSDSSGKDAAAKDPDAKPDRKAKSKAKFEPEFVRKTDAEWRKILTRTQYMVTRQKATEPAFSGAYATGHFRGMFLCVCCDAEVFSAQSKFDSGTGWPSFDRPASVKSTVRAMDYDALEPRIEVMCRRCGAHLGHVFDDGPTMTGLRFCINSAAIKLRPPEGESAPKASSRTASRSSKARAKTRMTKTNSKAKSKSTAAGPPSDSPESSGPAEADRPAQEKAAPAAKPSE
jgi:peptide-methionine (R)-S-oxide reductase